MWAEKIADELLQQNLKVYNFTTGVTPSGPFHVGHLREILTASIVAWFVKQKGGKTRLFFILDDFDHLRKLYPFLPKDFEKYIGQPLCLIPDPEGCHKNYAEHFFAPFEAALKYLGLKPKIVHASWLYRTGKFVPYIETALKNKDKIARILREVAHTKIDKDFSPFKPLCPKCHTLVDTKITKVDYRQKKVSIVCKKCGYKGSVSYKSLGGKLIWRLHWVAWWQHFNTTAEPFGKEHASVGSSYDTGKALMEKIFNRPAPRGIPYDLVYLKGARGKMSSSQGNVVGVHDLVSSLPPELVKYIILRVLPEKPIFFEPRDVLRLSDEISADLRRFQKQKLSDDKIKLYQYIFDTLHLKRVQFVPWGHFVLITQLTQGKILAIQRMLRKSGFRLGLNRIKLLAPKALNWVKMYGTDEEKISVSTSPPKLHLSPQQRKFLISLKENWQRQNLKESELQNLIYELIKKEGLSPKQGFGLLYQIFLRRDSGPRAGLLLTLIGKRKALEMISQIVKR